MEAGELSTLVAAWGYPSLLALLLLTGIGSPIPEDLLLLTAGYLVHLDIFQWPLALAICLVGVVGSDLMLYSAGRHLAWRTGRAEDDSILSAARLQAATRWFSRCGPVLVLIARLTPGTRAVVFITAGVQAVPVGAFLRFDALGAAIWVPAALAAGYALAPRLGDLQMLVDSVSRDTAWILLVSVALVVLWLWLGREESKL